METTNKITIQSLFFSRSDDLAKGRLILILYGVLNTLTINLADGAFYSSFLLMNDINVAKISILSFVPYIATLFSFLSPILLTHMKRRKWILFFAKLFTQLLKIGGITLLPYITDNGSVRIIGFCALLFISAFVDALFYPGYLDWHIKFVPDKFRPKYFSVQFIFNSLFPYGFAMLISYYVDKVRGTPAFSTAIIGIRIAAVVLSVISCVILLLPQEFKYDFSEKATNIADIFRIPLANKKYCKTIIIFMLYTFSLSINAGILNAYFLTELNVSYTMINATNAAFGFIILLTSGIWQTLIAKIGWFKSIAVSCLLSSPIYFAFVMTNNKNAFILFPILRIIEHFSATGRQITTANLFYINTPNKNSAYYISFAQPMSALSTFLAYLFGSLIVLLFKGKALHFIGLTINYGQFLYLLQAILCIFLFVYVWLAGKELDPTYNKR